MNPVLACLETGWLVQMENESPQFFVNEYMIME